MRACLQVCTMFTHVPTYAEINPPESATMLRAASQEFLEASAPALELDGFIAFLKFADLMVDEGRIGGGGADGDGGNGDEQQQQQTFMLSEADARQIFIAANVEMDETGNLDLQLINQMNSDLALCRYEFIEALIRIALLKYSSVVESHPADAVKMLLYVCTRARARVCVCVRACMCVCVQTWVCAVFVVCRVRCVWFAGAVWTTCVHACASWS